jgi:hypothetical protein
MRHAVLRLHRLVDCTVCRLKTAAFSAFLLIARHGIKLAPHLWQ